MKILAAARRVVESGGTVADPPVSLKVVTDEVGSPTYTIDLATGLLELQVLGVGGLVHLVSDGWCSRYELALETLRLAGLRVPEQVVVEAVTTDAFPTKARRPRNSVLDCSRAAALGVRLPAWRDGLRRFLADEAPAE